MELNIGTLVIIAVVALILYFYTQCDKKNEGYSNINHINIPGFNLLEEPLTNKTMEECSNECINNPNCLFWNYDKNNKTCWLKKGEKNDNIITGFNINRSEPVIIKENINIPGTTYNLPNMPIKNVSNKEQCAESCRKNDCTFWNYDKQTKECWLNRGIPQTNVITGFNIPSNKYSSYSSLDNNFNEIIKNKCKNKCCQTKCDISNNKDECEKSCNDDINDELYKTCDDLCVQYNKWNFIFT